MGFWRPLTTRRLFFFSFLKFVILLSFVESPQRSWAAPDKSWSYSTNDWGTNPFSHNDHIHKGIEVDQEFEAMATKVIAGVLIFVVLASFIAFLVCLCCPICLLAKMRQRRRGFVYQTAANGAAAGTAQNGDAQVNVAQNAPLNHGPVSVTTATTANNRNSPYPVQQSVTVMPAQNHPQPYAPNHMGYPMGPGNVPPYPTAPGAMPVPINAMPDLPPPYPGLSRESDSVQQAQPPFNPYFSGGDEESGRNPYMTTTAPYPSKH